MGRGQRKLCGPAIGEPSSPCRRTTACKGVQSGETPPVGYKRSAALIGPICPLNLRGSASCPRSSAENTILSHQRHEEGESGQLRQNGEDDETDKRVIIKPAHRGTS